MSTAEIYGQCLESLRAGEEITAITCLRETITGLAAWIPEGVDGEEAEKGFPALHAELESCLAAALPLLDFGSQRGCSEVIASVQRLALLNGENTQLLREPLLSLALHDFAWSLMAECLAADRLVPLPALAAVVVPDPHYPTTTPIYEIEGLRHPSAFGRSAEGAYGSWRDWFASNERVKALPHLVDRSRRLAAAAEAELVAAMRFTVRHGNRTFCGSLGEGVGERWVRVHCQGPQLSAIAAALGIGQTDNFEVALNERYASLCGPDELGRPRFSTLFEVS